mmetsp:Transcript_47925/g.134928  ORF Transcript_47925/g.134928 Transcript_47925/m.134928 type:complete len:217 (+) Transcript_47925:213-863(+)
MLCGQRRPLSRATAMSNNSDAMRCTIAASKPRRYSDVLSLIHIPSLRTPSVKHNPTEENADDLKNSFANKPSPASRSSATARTTRNPTRRGCVHAACSNNQALDTRPVAVLAQTSTIRERASSSADIGRNSSMYMATSTGGAKPWRNKPRNASWLKGSGGRSSWSKASALLQDTKRRRRSSMARTLASNPSRAALEPWNSAMSRCWTMSKAFLAPA